MIRRALPVLLCLVVAILGMVLFVEAEGRSPGVLYRGEVVFNSTEDYNNFKIFLGRPEVEVIEIQVLASEPPILVKYNIVVPRKDSFPYTFGSVDSGIPSNWWIFALMIAAGMGGVIAFTVVPIEKKDG